MSTVFFRIDELADDDLRKHGFKVRDLKGEN
jgi:hypothetical protein